MKKRLFEMAGHRGGLDMTRDAKRPVVKHLKLFEGMGRPDPEAQDLRGTSWKLLFTDSESRDPPQAATRCHASLPRAVICPRTL
jgi:hypothetical protein